MFQFTGTTVHPGTYHLSLETASGKDNAQVGTFLTGLSWAGAGPTMRRGRMAKQIRSRFMTLLH